MTASVLNKQTDVPITVAAFSKATSSFLWKNLILLQAYHFCNLIFTLCINVPDKKFLTKSLTKEDFEKRKSMGLFFGFYNIWFYYILLNPSLQ